MTENQSQKAQPDCDVVVVGSGFAGIYALWQASQRGLSVRGFERGSDVGGTWYWNAYPGARCDVESYNYAYFFNNEVVRDWNWSDACAGQQEIQRYLRFVAERCDVLKDITFNTKVISARYDETTGWWSVRTSAGDTIVSRYVVLAIGALFAGKGVEMRCDAAAAAILSAIPGAVVKAATEADWAEEYLAPIISIRVVESLDEAMAHIARYGSHHTDAILTRDHANAMRFLREVDSASVMVNTSTRFADGFEYGLGAEIGISTDKFHARGPVGLEGLTSLKWVVLGQGEVRT
jgi:hypothetical protein